MLCLTHIPGLLLNYTWPFKQPQAAPFCANRFSASWFSLLLQQKVDESQEVGLHLLEVFSCVDQQLASLGVAVMGNHHTHTDTY